MALANAALPMALPLPAADQNSNMHSLLLLAGTPAANLLLANQYSSMLQSSAIGSLVLPHQNGQTNVPPSFEDIQQQERIKLECQHSVDTSDMMISTELRQQQQKPMVPMPKLAATMAMQPVGQQLLDRALWELLLARNLSLFGQSILPGLLGGLSTQTQSTVASPNPFTTAPNVNLHLHDANAKNNASSLNEVVEEQHKSASLDGSLLESLSWNKLGRSYNPGRPLGMLDRQKILELYQKGLKISHIAKVIGVTHSCVSKIMTRYRRTGSIHPRSAQLTTFGRRQPAAFSSSPLIAPNSLKTSLPFPLSSWQQPWPAGIEEMSMLKCSVPSAFQKIQLSHGERPVSSDEEGSSRSTVSATEWSEMTHKCVQKAVSGGQAFGLNCTE